MINVAVSLLPHFSDLPLPACHSAQAAGMDLAAAITSPVILPPGEWRTIPCGFCLELPEGFEAQLRPRSGLAAKFGVTVLNSPGTIDADYRGEIMVILINHGKTPFTVERGMRIAQMVISSVTQVTLVPGSELSETERGAGGLGSTGLK